MKRPLIMGLVVALLTVGIAHWLLYISVPSYAPLLPTQPEDRPLTVFEPPESGHDQTPLVALPSLASVDRRVIEPPGLVRPRYCLLVFGPRAKTRVWMVQAGEILYVDRNANGDLTEAGEAFAPSERKESQIVGEEGKEAPYREWTYEIGDLLPSDGSGRHTQFKVVGYQTGTGPAEQVVSVWVNGLTLQYAGWGSLLADSRDKAPVVHFGGPVVPRSLGGPALRLTMDAQELGKYSFAYVGYEAIPHSIRPLVAIDWPTGSGSLTEWFALAKRC
jgi:hypothetical protein